MLPSIAPPQCRSAGRVIALREVGGLHHRYERARGLIVYRGTEAD